MADAIRLRSQTSTHKTYQVHQATFVVENRYSLIAVLGRGSYGTVCSARDEVIDRNVAIKRVTRLLDDLIDGRRVLREIKLLRILKEHKCRNALPLLRIQRPIGSIDNFSEVYIITELMSGDLYNRIKRRSPIRVERIATQLLQCIADMHELTIIHRDIKPANVLLSQGGDAWVCDFGLARAGTTKCSGKDLRLTDFVVTRWYRAPELLLMLPYCSSVDVWSAGCVLAECFMGRPLFPGRDYIMQLQLILSTVPCTASAAASYSDDVRSFVSEMEKNVVRRPLTKQFAGLSAPPEAVQLLIDMLKYDATERCTAAQALRSPYLSSTREVTQVRRDVPQEDWSFDSNQQLTEPLLRAYLWEEINRCSSLM